MVEARVGRLLVLGYPGALPGDELFSFAREFGLGGMILFARNCPDVRTLREGLAQTRARLRELDPGWSPLVMVDQEGGRVERIRHGVPHLPSATELADQGCSAAQRSIWRQAVALRELGVDVNLAPVCDVRQEGECGVIGDRSFGSDPGAVAELVGTHIQACLEAGLLPCAKHFPGHGAARVDSHKELPLLGKTRREFELNDLVPFRAAVRAGVPLVMAGHLLCPEISVRPATLSAAWLEGVLRDQLEFRGGVISDDMEMHALDELGQPGKVAVDAVVSGCDLLIYGRTLRPDLNLFEVADALRHGLPAARIESAQGRVRALTRACS